LNIRKVHILTQLMIRSALSILLSLIAVSVSAQQSSAAAPAAGRAIGTITAINGNRVTVKTDAGADMNVTVEDSTRIVKLAPGQKDLKDATPIRLQDTQVGDRALVRGTPGEGSNSLTASSMIVMKQADVANRQQQEMQEWQRRGTGGIVRSVDPASGTITIASSPNQTVVIQTSPTTQFLRYASDSVKFSDAKKSSLDEVKPGDQLRSRGTRSPDGQQLTAETVISGSFRNIAGTVSSVDPAAGTLNVMDLITKKPAVVKITPETQMRQIPPEMAQRIAMFLRRPAGGGNGSQPSGSPGGGGTEAMRSGGLGAGPGGQGGPPDFQQIIRRMPAATINDLKKGDAVMIVTTQGAPGQEVTALNLLSGVEPILTAAPSQTSAASLLSGWSMGGGEGESQ
jgi:Cu/Ag efflux protein CusF